MSTLPKRLQADLEPVYRGMLLTRSYTPLQGVDNMTGYPPGVSSHGDTWADAVADPSDPIAPLEHGDHMSVSTEERGRRILPMPILDNPDRSPNLNPDLAEAESRPVSPFRFLSRDPVLAEPQEHRPLDDTACPILGEVRGKDPERRGGVWSPPPGSAIAGPSGQHRSRSGNSHGDDESAGHGVVGWATPPDEPQPSVVPGPLKVNQKAREAFRARLREALEIVGDESKPLTLSSLASIVNEITDLDSRLALLEKKLDADRRSTRALIGTMARSEAAASERRMQDEVAGLRRQVNTWRLQVPVTAPPADAGRPRPTPPPATTPALAQASGRGFDYD
jgi:uncharacterized tellurite resistance protein B-like protein